MKRSGLHILVLLLIAGTISGWFRDSYAAPGPQSGPQNAFHLSSLPDDYAKLETLFASLREGGADSVIIGPSTGAMPDNETLPNIVYLAHQAELKIYFILPSRNLPQVLSSHPEWEDLRYDLTSGTLQGTGRLDLFNPDASDYIVKTMKEVASYWIDGILFGSDFYYGNTEGMSAAVMDEYLKKFSAALIPGRAIVRVGNLENRSAVLEYGDGFREWTEMKKERLIGVLQNVMMAARSVNNGIQFGIALRGPELEQSGDALARYAFDLSSFNVLSPDFYWLSVPHRDMREARHLTYKRSIEELGRIAMDTAAMVKEPFRALILVQTATRSGRVLPLSEIEDAAAAVKKSGISYTGYMLKQDGLLPAVLTKKMFRK